MPMDAERFVERAFQVLFERAADAGDRAGGKPPVARPRPSIRGRAGAHLLRGHPRALGAREGAGPSRPRARRVHMASGRCGRPSPRRSRDPGPDRHEPAVHGAQRLGAEERFLGELAIVRDAIGERFAGTWLRSERHQREWHFVVVDPTPEEVELVADGKLESHRQRRARSPRNAGHASTRYSVKKGHQMKSLVTAMTSVFGGQTPTAIR
jgi:hypothetical protein